MEQTNDEELGHACHGSFGIGEAVPLAEGEVEGERREEKPCGREDARRENVIWPVERLR